MEVFRPLINKGDIDTSKLGVVALALDSPLLAAIQHHSKNVDGVLREIT